MRARTLASVWVGVAALAAMACTRKVSAEKPVEGGAAAPASSPVTGPAGKQADDAHDEASGLSLLGLAKPSQSPVMLGTNLAAIAADSGAFPFVDQLTASGPWVSVPHNGNGAADERPLKLDDDGWVRALEPDQAARAVLVDALPAAVARRRFTVLWTGEGTLRFDGGVEDPASRKPGRTVVTMPPTSTRLSVTIAALDAVHPLRDLHVLHEGGRCTNAPARFCATDAQCTEGARCIPFEENFRTQPFHPDFLAELSGFGTLRFTEWMGASTGTAPTAWAAWPRMTSARWHVVPVELMTGLANELGADAWVSVPHLASDDFVRQLARELHTGLRAGLRLYVEYSHEPWNDTPASVQALWVAGEGCKVFGDKGDCDTDGDGTLCEWDDDRDEALQPTPVLAARARQVTANCQAFGRRYVSKRTAEVTGLFKEVFDDAGTDRLVRVLGASGGDPDLAETLLTEAWNGDEPTYKRVDAVAFAPYFGEPVTAENAESFLATPLDQVFARLNKVEAVDQHAPEGTHALLVESWLVTRAYAGLLKSRPEFEHLVPLAYGGGQALVAVDDHASQSESSAVSQRLAEINRDPRMADVYAQWLRSWQALTGGSTFVHYTSAQRSQGGGAGFGHKEYQGQPRSEAPKYDALMRFLGR